MSVLVDECGNTLGPFGMHGAGTHRNPCATRAGLGTPPHAHLRHAHAARLSFALCMALIRVMRRMPFTPADGVTNLRAGQSRLLAERSKPLNNAALTRKCLGVRTHELLCLHPKDRGIGSARTDPADNRKEPHAQELPPLRG